MLSSSMEQKLGSPLDNWWGTWMYLTSDGCVTYYIFPGGPVLPTKRSTDVLIRYYSPTLSVPAADHNAHADRSMNHSQVLRVTRLESVLWLTMSHLTPDDQVQHYATQRWSGNCLSSGTEPMCMQRPRRYGNIRQWTLSNTMSMYRDNEYLSKNTNNIVQILYLRLC